MEGLYVSGKKKCRETNLHNIQNSIQLDDFRQNQTLLVPRPELMGRYKVFAFSFFSYNSLVLRDQRLNLRLRVDYPSIIRVNRKLFAVLLVQTAQPDFCHFFMRSSFFFLKSLLTPLITASYLVASSQAKSYGRLKTTYSDRLT